MNAIGMKFMALPDWKRLAIIICAACVLTGALLLVR